VVAAAREDAALHRQPVVLRERKTRMPTLVLRRQDHHLDARALVEGEQLVDEREGHAGPRWFLQRCSCNCM